MALQTIEIEIYDSLPGVRSKLVGQVLATRFTTYYGPGGDRMRCWYTATLVRTEDGRLWLNHPTTPAYPEEISLENNSWSLAGNFPKCCPALPGMLAEARAKSE